MITTIDFTSGTRMDRNPLLAHSAVRCDVCGVQILAGEATVCADGCVRTYGDFVLLGEDLMDDENWPSAHVRCVRGAM
jgi:hypothetical protein